MRRIAADVAAKPATAIHDRIAHIHLESDKRA